jgi:hypothetical protein
MKYEQYDNIIKHNSWWLRLEVTSTEQKCNTSRQKLPGTHILELPHTDSCQNLTKVVFNIAIEMYNY